MGSSPSAGTHPFSQMQPILINLIPLIGILFFNWDAKPLLATYWLENVVNGIFHLIRIAKSNLRLLKKIFVISFFTIHYGAFCAGHGFFIVALTTPQTRVDLIFEGNLKDLNQIFFNNHFLPILITLLVIYTWDLLSTPTSPAPSAPLPNTNNSSTSAASIMSQPYSRIIFLHFGIVIGGAFAAAQNSPLWILIILIAAKTLYDIHSIRKKTKTTLPPTTPPTSQHPPQPSHQ